MTEEMAAAAILARPGEGLLEASAREARYADLARQIAAVTGGEGNVVSRMATSASLLHYAFDAWLWTGFYMVDPEKKDELVVGPYQGTLGCLRIPFAQGVCGAAARRRESIIVADVDAFPGHIVCDTASRSEIAVPVFDRSGALIAVLDVDSNFPAAFDEIDARWLEAITGETFSG